METLEQFVCKWNRNRLTLDKDEFNEFIEDLQELIKNINNETTS